MAVSLQVLYPATPETTFDHDYYQVTHMPLVQKHLGPHLIAVQASRGLASGPQTPPAYHAIATLLFDNLDTLETAMAAAEPVLADIPKFTDARPQMLIGEVIG